MRSVFLAVSRIVVGLIFLVSGLEKTISPYQNFLYVIQGYQFLPVSLEILTARILPWVELIVGIFLILGLWTRAGLMAAAAMFAGFIVIVGQALVRGIDLSECGCFGQLVHIPPQVIFVMDSWFLLICLLSLKYIVDARKWSLDDYFHKT